MEDGHLIGQTIKWNYCDTGGLVPSEKGRLIRPFLVYSFFDFTTRCLNLGSRILSATGLRFIGSSD
jgi:hypothetical protein